MTQQRWARRPEGSTWGDFGPDDQLGRLNLIDAAKTRQGLAEAREGRVFCLSLPLDLPGGSDLNPRRRPPILRPTLRGEAVNFDAVPPGGGASDVICDDLAILHLQYSTQWDALCHVGGLFDADGDGVAEHVFYNGYRGGVEIVAPAEAADAGLRPDMRMETTTRVAALGIETMAGHGVQGRGVMVDLRAHLSDARTLVDHEMLAGIMAADGVTVEPGDVLVLHTGFAQRVLEMAGDPDPDFLHGGCAVLDGRDPALLDWITDSGIAAIAADNYAVEAFPARPGTAGCCAILPLHEHCLFKLGVPLGELWHLTPLADWLRRAGRNRFLLTAPPLRLPGAVGSPVTPIATV